MRKNIDWFSWDILKTTTIFIILFEVILRFPKINSNLAFFENMGGFVQKILAQSMNEKATLGCLFIMFSGVFALCVWYSFRMVFIVIFSFRYDELETGPFTRAYQWIKGLLMRMKRGVA
jgi:hypothetical protein